MVSSVVACGRHKTSCKRHKTSSNCIPMAHENVAKVTRRYISITSGPRDYQTATLHNHVSGKVHGLQRVPHSVLTPAEEQALQDWLVEMAKIGYGKSRKQLRYAVKKILQKEERKNPFKDNNYAWPQMGVDIASI